MAVNSGVLLQATFQYNVVWQIAWSGCNGHEQIAIMVIDLFVITSQSGLGLTNLLANHITIIWILQFVSALCQTTMQYVTSLQMLLATEHQNWQ